MFVVMIGSFDSFGRPIVAAIVARGEIVVGSEHPLRSMLRCASLCDHNGRPVALASRRRSSSRSALRWAIAGDTPPKRHRACEVQASHSPWKLALLACTEYCFLGP